ncbi:MAG: T9SS type A sorting domain-containing protein, partial [Flavobacteriales bacterium]|nr:T9SS type A sorting domain-containing protein [Flavobacteriales bacterium]
QIDEGVQTVYFIDNDGDTYGNPSVSILACTQPIGYTPDDTDCNDTDANINPGAEDIGGNGIDENCDGEIDNSIFELNATISLYPNPTRSELNIQVNSSIIGSDLYIFDAVGKLVHKQQLLSTQTAIPVSNFADGNYVLRVGEVVKRFVVEK